MEDIIKLIQNVGKDYIEKLGKDFKATMTEDVFNLSSLGESFLKTLLGNIDKLDKITINFQKKRK